MTDYEHGVYLLMNLLHRHWFIPEPTIESLCKYFPIDRPRWQELIEEYGRERRAPRQLLRRVKFWEHIECERAKPLGTASRANLARRAAEARVLKLALARMRVRP
jgi:hypothetical protein